MAVRKWFRIGIIIYGLCRKELAMSQRDFEDKIRRLEERVEHLEHFIMQSLIFRVEDLAEVVETSLTGTSSPKSREVTAHARHVADKARVASWTDDGP